MNLKSYPFFVLGAGLAAIAILPNPAHQPNQTSAAKNEQKISTKSHASFAQIPLSFEANKGQTDDRVNFLARGTGYTIFLTPDEAVLSLVASARPADRGQEQPRKSAVVRLSLGDSHASADIEPLEQLPGKSNYFIGNNPKLWHTDIPLYSKVRYGGVYPGIDIVYHGNQRQLEYDFVVAAGADPSVIKINFGGTDQVNINPQGDLVLHAGGGEVVLQKP